jgi:hypothetical protein
MDLDFLDIDRTKGEALRDQGASTRQALPPSGGYLR